MTTSAASSYHPGPWELLLPGQPAGADRAQRAAADINEEERT